MRGLLLLITMVLLFGFIFPKNEKKLIGRWEIYKIQKPDNKPKMKRKKYIIFSQNGELLGGRIGESPNKKGTWGFDKKSNILSLRSTEGNKDDGGYLVDKLTRRNLILIKDSVYVYLEKTRTK